MNAETLGLEGENAALWIIYVDYLYRSHVRLKYEEDSLIWSKNQALGQYIVCLGYKVMFTFEAQNPKW